MPKYGPQENGYNLFLEKTFIGGLLVTGVGYGVQLVLYVTCLLHLWNQRKRNGKATHFLSAYITVLFMLESLFVSSSTWIIEDMYINNRNYPGGPLAYFVASVNQPEYITILASLLAMTFLSDLLVLWRCWVIWTTSGKRIAYAVVTFPIILFLASLAFGIIWVALSTRSSYYTRQYYNSTLLTAFGTTYYVTSLSVNVLVTVLIILRLLLHRRLVLKNLPLDHGRGYMSVATILVESAALYSTSALAFIVSFIINSPMDQIFMILSSTCQQTAGYLIIIRVAQGHTWSSTTLRKADRDTQLTTIRFKPPVNSRQFDASQNLADTESQGDYFARDTLINGGHGSNCAQEYPEYHTIKQINLH